jgi:hypothetical protein
MVIPPTASAVDRMIAALDAFVADPTDEATVGDLYSVTEGFDDLSELERARVIPAMFRVMERHPAADLGSPGPLVHAIESLGVPAYEAQLLDSVHRRPTYLNLWMVNRILNVASADESRRAALLSLLCGVQENPKWLDVAGVAADFLRHQAERPAG